MSTLRPWLRSRSRKSLIAMVVVAAGIILLAGGGVYAALGGVIRRDPVTNQGLIRSWYTGMNGNLVTDLTSNANYPLSPAGTDVLPKFQATDWNNSATTQDWADTYGQWVRGYLRAPETGTYYFWVASDDQSELWLSTDSTTANKTKISRVDNWTASLEWNKEVNQKSVGVQLTAGQFYYIEALQKEGAGGDNLAAGWRKPSDGSGASPTEIIPASVLYQKPNTDVDLQKGLVGHWKLDGDAKDATPFGRNGTVTGSSNIADRKGKTAGAKSFNGSSDRITVNNFDSTVMTSSSFGASWTLSVWAKDGGSNAGEHIILGKEGCNSGIETNGSGGYMFILFDAACQSTTPLSFTPANPTTVWHLITGTYVGGVMKLYVDGSFISTATAPSMFPFGNELGIGGGSGAPYYSFGGSVDDARVYNRELSAVEIKALYDQYDVSTQAGSGEKGLVGQWKMDGNAKDSTPNGSNGTVTNAALTNDRKGRASSAYSFNGSNTDIVLPSNPVLNSSIFTFSAWIYPTNTAVGTIIGSTSGTGPQFRFGGGQLTLLKQGIVQYASSNNVIPQNQWSHVAVSYSASGNFVYYVNGQSQGSGTNMQTYSFSNYAIGRASYANEKFIGSIDDVRIYNRVLTAAEIKQQYESYDSQINLNSTPTANTTGGNINQGLVGYWPFSGNAKDSTPYSNNGTVNGAVLTSDRKNSAYSFNGTSQSIQASAAGFPTTTMSISFWTKQSTLADWYDLVSNNYAGAGSNGWEVFTTVQGNVYFGYWQGGTQHLANTNNSSFTANQWHHIVGTFDGTLLRVYVDGVMGVNTSGTITGAALSTTGPFRIGDNGGGGISTHSIDDVRLYNRALSLTEVQSLYASPN